MGLSPRHPLPASWRPILVSQALGWTLVPPTVIVLGPYGQGAVQLFVEADFSQHYFTFRDEPALQPAVAAHRRLRSGDQQRRPQGRPHPAHDRGPLGDRSRRLLPRPAQAAHGDLGIRRPLPVDSIVDLAGLRAQLESGCALHAELAGLLSAAELAELGPPHRAGAERRPFPDPDPQRRSYPWPWSEKSLALAPLPEMKRVHSK